jgi:hypothetical protein
MTTKAILSKLIIFEPQGLSTGQMNELRDAFGLVK